MSIISFKNINLKLRRAFELLSVFYNVLERQNTLMIQQEALLREVKQIYNLPGKSEPTLIRYIDFLAELGLIGVKHEFIRRGFVRKFITPTIRGVILSYLYGVSIPETVYRFASQGFKILDYIPRDAANPLELTFDKVFMYMLLLGSASGMEFGLIHRDDQDFPSFFNRNICLSILSKLTNPIKNVSINDIINLFPNKVLKESLKDAKTMDDVKVILEKELLWSVLNAMISKCNNMNDSKYPSCLDELKRDLPYRDIQVFIGVMNNFWPDILGNKSFVDKFIELIKGRDPTLEQQLWSLYRLIRKILKVESE